MTDIVLGIVVPACVFIFSYIMTHLLYRHFAGQSGVERTSSLSTGTDSKREEGPGDKPSSD